MTTDLREALRDLARHTEPGSPPVDLWARGVRRARRRRAAGATLALAAVLVVALGGVSSGLLGLRPRPAQPADVPASSLRVPDRIFVPSPWAPGTDELGPPGVLAVLAPVEHRRTSWFSTGPAWFGISAADGDYRYLDLPGADPGTEPALSPDGRSVGYAYTGPVPPRAQSHVVGIAVYDTTTGHVTRWRLPGRYGLETGTVRMAWSPDSSYLVDDVGEWMAGRGMSHNYRVLAFPRAGGRPVRVAGDVSPSQFGHGRDGAVTWFEEGLRFRTVRPGDGPGTLTDIDQDGGALTIGPDRSTFVMTGLGPVGRSGSETERFFVGTLPARGEIARTRLVARGWQADRVLGWVDPHRVLVSAHPLRGEGLRVVTLDTRTGDVGPGLRVHLGPNVFVTPQVAADLLTRPLAAGRRPPGHGDPRLPAAGALALVALVLGAGLLLRRRRAHG